MIDFKGHRFEKEIILESAKNRGVWFPLEANTELIDAGHDPRLIAELYPECTPMLSFGLPDPPVFSALCGPSHSQGLRPKEMGVGQVAQAPLVRRYKAICAQPLKTDKIAHCALFIPLIFRRFQK